MQSRWEICKFHQHSHVLFNFAFKPSPFKPSAFSLKTVTINRNHTLNPYHETTINRRHFATLLSSFYQCLTTSLRSLTAARFLHLQSHLTRLATVHQALKFDQESKINKPLEFHATSHSSSIPRRDYYDPTNRESTPPDTRPPYSSLADTASLTIPWPQNLSTNCRLQS
jgi:hypothetical protein